MSKSTKQLVIFLAATFIWTWAFYAPIAIGRHNQSEMPWMIFLILGGMGPSLVAVVMVLLSRDQEARRDYWRRCFSLKRISRPGWGIILLTFPAIFALSVGLDLLLGGTAPGMIQFRSLMANPVMWLPAAFISFMSGPWSEEFGWRGYALDRFLTRFGPIPASIVLGLIWAVWHLPLYFMGAGWHAEMGFKLAGFWTFIGQNVGLALIMTWVYLSNKRSILSAMLLHFTSNFTGQLLAPVSDRSLMTYMILMVAVGLYGCSRIGRESPAAAGSALRGEVPVL